jgi:hypothetical protein
VKSSSIPVTFTLFPRAEASIDRAKEVETTWEVFAKKFSEFDYVKDKQDSVLLLPVRFAAEATTKSMQFVEDVHMATLDVDDATFEEFDALINYLEENKYKALVYTTYSNMDSARGIDKKGEETEPTIRARVVLPLSRPVKAIEWKFFWRVYNDLFFGLADKICKDPSRGYFAPSIHEKWKGTEEEKNYAIAFEIEGEKVLEVDWLLASYKDDIKNHTVEAQLPDQKTAYAVPRELIAAYARNLRRRRREDLQDIGFKMLKGLRGEVFEAPGSRDTMVFKFAQELASRFPGGKVADIVEPFAPALAAMEEQEPGSPSKEDFADKLLRAQAQVVADQETKKREREAKEHEEQQKRESAPKYTKDQIADFMDKYGIDGDVEDFKLIVIHKGLYYLFGGDKYLGPYLGTDLLPACRRILEMPAQEVGFSMVYEIDGGDGPPKLKKKSKEEIISDYATIADEVEYNLEGKSYYDPSTNVLHLSHIKLPKIEAEWSNKVDAWLREMFPMDRDYEKMCDWLSQTPDLTRALAALCLVGPPDVGKSALALGIARCWNTLPVPMSVAFDTFNGEMLRSPVVISDEDLPRDHRGRVQTEALRKLISSGEHNINEKNQPRVTLKGYMRCIVAMNNIENFNFGRSGHSGQDIEAIQKRFLVMEIFSRKAAELFDYEDFVLNDGIAKHIMWLHENRQRAEDRFGVVTGSKSQVALGDNTVSELLDFVAEKVFSTSRCFAETGSYDSKFRKGILVAPGRKVFVRSTSLKEELSFDNPRKWNKTTLRDITTLLSAICTEKCAVKLKRSRNRSLMWQIDLDILIKHAMRSDFVDQELFDKFLDLYHDAEYLSDLAPSLDDVAKKEAASIYLQSINADDLDDLDSAE